jgi:hypothetical protein
METMSGRIPSVVESITIVSALICSRMGGARLLCLNILAEVGGEGEELRNGLLDSSYSP